MRILGLLLSLTALAGAVGCREEAARFPVVITALTDEGKPFPDLPVTLGRSPAGKTDGEGHLSVHVRGKEGQKVAVEVTVPKGYRLAAPAAPLVLRRLIDMEGGSGRPLSIEHVIKLSPLQRSYAVLVRVGVPGLPVQVFGAQQALTNERGVAAFLYTGSPGDELQVRLDTSGHPELRPQNPVSSFLLAQRSEAYVVKERFTVNKPPSVKRHHKTIHVGPRPL